MENALLLTMQCLIRAEGCTGSVEADERSVECWGARVRSELLQDALSMELRTRCQRCRDVNLDNSSRR
jgi:hypothetical protein